MRVVVVGLGPAGVDWLLPAARRALETHDHRYVRTTRHPAVAELARERLELTGFDEVYDAGSALDAVYDEIVARVLAAAAEHGTVVYAVPGSPAVAERTVELLREVADRGDIELEVIAGISFAELAWNRLGIDPMALRARVLDGRALDGTALESGSVLVAQCDTPMVLSDVKLALLEHHDGADPVTVLQRLGLPDEQVVELALEDLDRTIVPDHLTAVWVPDHASRVFTAATSAGTELARLLALSRRLRQPGGCPWDAEQTHHSLTRYLLEEAYEVVEVVEELPAGAPGGVAADDPRYAALVDELGDLLYQVVFHAVLAEEASAFDLADVARGVHDKLVRRHPHVFGDVDATTTAEVMTNWEQIKKAEKRSTSIVSDITPGLPSLLYAHKLLRKSASVGLDPGDTHHHLRRIDTASGALRAGAGPEAETVLGELLAAAVALARSLGVDAESALRGWSARFRGRFQAMEALAAERGLDLTVLDSPGLEGLWAEAAHGPQGAQGA